MLDVVQMTPEWLKPAHSQSNAACNAPHQICNLENKTNFLKAYLDGITVFIINKIQLVNKLKQSNDLEMMVCITAPLWHSLQRWWAWNISAVCQNYLSN